MCGKADACTFEYPADCVKRAFAAVGNRAYGTFGIGEHFMRYRFEQFADSRA